MQQFFKFMFASCLGVLLAMMVFGFIAVLMIGSAASSLGSKDTVRVKPNSVLELKFQNDIPEKTNNVAPDGFAFETDDVIGLTDMVTAIEYAKTDDNIKGIFLDLNGAPGGMVTRSTIRDALLDFKESNKFIVAYSKYYTQHTYYLASVADDISVHPVGGIDFRGFGAQIPFFKNALDKLGVEIEVYYAGQFKSATEPYRLTEMSEQNRRQIREYLEPLYDKFLSDIGEVRNISVEELKRIANEWLIRTADDAVTHGLADRVGYRDEVLDVLRTKIGLEKKDKIQKVSIQKYAHKAKPKIDFKIKDKIAVIYAEGTIVMGKDAPGSVADDDYGPMIRKIRQDDRIKGIVLRVNSPGGSAFTSESIWRELSLAQKDGKPIVVSMGDYAASGGYYIACLADKIVAEPSTITGSIGVFATVPNASVLMNDKIGISLDTLNLARYASSFNLFHDHAPDEAAIFQQMTDNAYEVFLQRVAKGRNMTREEVHAIAQGRVWTGEKAMELGLVDELGGLEKAISIAEEITGLEEYRISEYPKTKDPFQQLMDKYFKLDQAKLKARQEILQSELGELYPYYQQLKEVKEVEGPQARLPFLIDLK